MEPETLVRRVALVAIPALILVGYWLRVEPEEPAAQAPSARPPELGSAPAVGSALPAALGSVHLYGERAGAPAAPSPAPRQGAEPTQPSPAQASPAPTTAAVDLPELPRVAAPAPASGPCGGLIVRLITLAPDPKESTASIATGYAEGAKLLRVGDRIGASRVVSIEWDRVWVTSPSGRCAVGMHFGARQAESDLEQTLSAEEYARLPWVLPHAITSGMYKRSEMDWEFSATAIELLFARGADVFAGLRVKPVERDGVVVGLELHDLRLDSFLERLGLMPRDILLRIDHKPVTTVESVAEALLSAREADSLVVDLERDGEAYQLRLRPYQAN